MALIIQKYGGSAPAAAGRIRAVSRRVAEARARGDHVVAVVSAMGDTTDELISLARQVSEEPDPREMDGRLSTGELVSSTLLAMALRSLGAAQVSASLSTPTSPIEPQINLDEVLSCKSLWKGLYRMQGTGIFGMRGELRPEFTFGDDYPLATLEVDPDVLEEKWERTHPDLTE